KLPVTSFILPPRPLKFFGLRILPLNSHLPVSNKPLPVFLPRSLVLPKYSLIVKSLFLGFKWSNNPLPVFLVLFKEPLNCSFPEREPPFLFLPPKSLYLNSIPPARPSPPNILILSNMLPTLEPPEVPLPLGVLGLLLAYFCLPGLVPGGGVPPPPFLFLPLLPKALAPLPIK